MFFFQQKQIDIFITNVNYVLEFLTRLDKSGLCYSSLNTARSALSSFLQLGNSVNIGSHPLVCRFLRGVFIMRPALPRYNVTWNVDIVLNYLQIQEPLSELTLLHVSNKLLMSLVLLSGQRGQTLHWLDIRNICIYDDFVKIGIGDLRNDT